MVFDILIGVIGVLMAVVLVRALSPRLRRETVSGDTGDSSWMFTGWQSGSGSSDSCSDGGSSDAGCDGGGGGHGGGGGGD
jgi:hypothetical protein